MTDFRRLYSNTKDFTDSVDAGIKIIHDGTLETAPVEKDRPTLKSLLAVMITATIEPDTPPDDPAYNLRMDTVRYALLAAYNLGRENLKGG